jgi:type IV pilus assembly protein PilO
LDVHNLQIRTRISQLQERDLFKQFNDIVNNRRQVENDIAQLPILQETLKNWEKNLVSASEMPIILDDLLKMASHNRLRLNLLDPQNELKDNLYNKTPVKIQLSGQFDEIASFLSQIANMGKIVMIGDFSFMRVQNISNQSESKLSKINYTPVLDWDGEVNIYKK